MPIDVEALSQAIEKSVRPDKNESSMEGSSLLFFGHSVSSQEKADYSRPEKILALHKDISSYQDPARKNQAILILALAIISNPQDTQLKAKFYDELRQNENFKNVERDRQQVLLSMVGSASSEDLIEKAEKAVDNEITAILRNELLEKPGIISKIIGFNPHKFISETDLDNIISNLHQVLNDPAIHAKDMKFSMMEEPAIQSVRPAQSG